MCEIILFPIEMVAEICRRQINCCFADVSKQVRDTPQHYQSNHYVGTSETYEFDGHLSSRYAQLLTDKLQNGLWISAVCLNESVNNVEFNHSYLAKCI